LRRTWRVLATDQARQLRKLGGPGKFLKETSQMREAMDVDGRRQWRSLGAQMGEPAEDVRVARPAVPWCGTAVRGASNWNWIWMGLATIR
jgi:hypothetical protein